MRMRPTPVSQALAVYHSQGLQLNSLISFFIAHYSVVTFRLWFFSMNVINQFWLGRCFKNNKIVCIREISFFGKVIQYTLCGQDRRITMAMLLFNK